MEDVARIIKQLLIKEPFYGLFLMGLQRKDGTSEIDTAAVGIEGINPVLYVNLNFWGTLDDKMKIAILKHELNHILMGHLTNNWNYLSDEDHVTLNEAQDCEINSFISELQTDPWCYPAAYNLENGKGTLYYYEQIKKQKKKGGGGSGSGQGQGQNSSGRKTVDDHKFFGKAADLSDAEKQLIEQQIANNTKRTAEQVQKQCGNIPGQFQEYVNNLFKVKDRIFNWKAYFRRSLGTMIDVELKKTKKRESVRFPGAAGSKHKRKAKVLVVVDTSGSISTKDLCDFFSEINHVYKAGTVVDIIEIDTQIQRQYTYTGTWDMKASGRGGTVLNDAIEYYNNHRRDYTAMVIFTDGYCNVDFKIYGKHMWILTHDSCNQKYPGPVIKIPANHEV